MTHGQTHPSTNPKRKGDSVSTIVTNIDEAVKNAKSPEQEITALDEYVLTTIERFKLVSGCSYIEAVVDYCTEHDIDIITMAKFITLKKNQNLLSRIETECVETGLVKPTTTDQADIPLTDIFAL